MRRTIIGGAIFRFLEHQQPRARRSLTTDPRNSIRMMARTHLSYDRLRPTGMIQSRVSVTTRLRGVGDSACALESIGAYWSPSAADTAIARSDKDSTQEQAIERAGAEIVKRGRTP